MTGSSVDEARDRALDRLGVDASDAEIEVVSEPQRALFGLRRVEARVRARVRPSSPPPRKEREGRRRSQSARSSKSPQRGQRGQRRGSDGEQGRGQAGRGSGSKADKVRTAGAERASKGRSKARREEKIEMDEIPSEDLGSMIVEFVEGLLAAFEMSGTVAVASVDDGVVEVAVTGDDLGLLIGPGGNTLAALTDVTKTVLQRRSNGSSRARVRIDVAGYREERRSALAAFALEVAESVKSSGEARAFEPMHSADRKVVHDAVNEIEGVGTISDGDEPRRRVVLVPES